MIMASQLTPDNRKWIVVAGPPGIEIGSVYDFYKRSTKKETVMPDKLQEFVDSLGVSRNKLKYSRELKKNTIPGRRGSIVLDNGTWEVEAIGESKRHWTGIKKQLSFMDLILESDENSGKFFLDRLPTVGEAKILRKVLKFRNTSETEKPSLPQP